MTKDATDDNDSNPPTAVGSNAQLGAELMWRQQRLESTAYYLASLATSGAWAAAAGASGRWPLWIGCTAWLAMAMAVYWIELRPTRERWLALNVRAEPPRAGKE